jgi:hypothetical protein
MKLAYIASDLSAIDNESVIASQNYEVIHFYLADQKPIYKYREIEKQILFIDHITFIPDEKQQTETHKNLKKRIQPSWNSFLHNVYAGRNYNLINEANDASSTKEVFSIDDISFIKFSRDQGKYSIENSKKHIVNYDYLLIENNQFTMNSIIEKQQNLFFSFTEQSRCLLTLKYKVQNTLFHFQQQREFILIDSSEVNSTFDNWYLILIDKDVLRCSFYIPIEIQRTEEYLNFLNTRIQEMICRQIVTISKLTYIESSLAPVDGYYRNIAQLRNSRAGALVPKYFLWSENKRKGHLQNILKTKNNFKQMLLEKKWKKEESYD